MIYSINIVTKRLRRTVCCWRKICEWHSYVTRLGGVAQFDPAAGGNPFRS
jgi:hypothetical protein